MEHLQAILHFRILENEVQTYLIFIGIILGSYIVFRFILSLVLRHLRKLAEKTSNDFDDLIIKTLHETEWYLFVILVLFYVDAALDLTGVAKQTVDVVYNVMIVFFGIKVGGQCIEYAITKLIKKKTNPSEQFSIEVIGKGLKILLWILGLMFLVSSFGYNISSLIAGLGIGGIAIALAVQNMLADILSAISIYLDKPFKVGDYIVVGDKRGTVKSIGIKTTRLTSLQGEEVVVSNKRLTESTIDNFGKMKKRRVVINLGVTYDTPLKIMKKIPEGLKKIIDSVEDATFSRAHFKSFGDFSKNFELVFYIESGEYGIYMDHLQEINLKIQEISEKMKFEFAFPTQTVYVEK